MTAGNFRKESLAKNVQKLFKTVSQATSSITALTSRTGVTPPTGYAGRVLFLPQIVAAGTRVGDSAAATAQMGAQITAASISNGEVASVTVRNGAATAQTVTLAWTFVGNF